MHVHQVQLSQEENEVYQKLLAFSRKALEDYIKGQEARVREGFTYNRTVIQLHNPCPKSRTICLLLSEPPRTATEECNKANDVGTAVAPSAGLLTSCLNPDHVGRYRCGSVGQ